MKGTGRLSFHDINLAYRAVTDENLPNGVDLDAKDMTFTFEQFCSLVAEYKYRVSLLCYFIIYNYLYYIPVIFSGALDLICIPDNRIIRLIIEITA